jgi:hypothetical protein
MHASVDGFSDRASEGQVVVSRLLSEQIFPFLGHACAELFVLTTFATFFKLTTESHKVKCDLSLG